LSEIRTVTTFQREAGVAGEPVLPTLAPRRANGGRDQPCAAARKWPRCWRWPRSSGAASTSARRLDQHGEPVPGQQAPYGCPRVEAFCEAENRPPVTLPYGPC